MSAGQILVFAFLSIWLLLIAVERFTNWWLSRWFVRADPYYAQRLANEALGRINDNAAVELEAHRGVSTDPYVEKVDR